MRNLASFWGNNRRIMISIGGSILVKGLALVLSFAATPAYIRYFDNNAILGIWFTVVSVVFWILSMDLGVGNGLRNRLTECFGKGDNELAKQYVSSSYVMFTILVSLIAAVGVTVIFRVDWNRYFSVGTEVVSSSSLQKTISIVLLTICAQLVLKLITSVYYALQKPVVPNALALITSASQYVFVRFVSFRSIEEKLIWLAIVFFISVNLPLLLTSFYVYAFRYRPIAPSMKGVSLQKTKSLLSLSGIFLVVQLLYLALASTNEMIISAIASTESVVEYSVYYKLYSLLPLATSVILTPVWSAVTDKMVREEYTWIKKLLFILNVYIAFTALLQLGLAFFGQPILRLWLGNSSIAYSRNTALLFAAYGITMNAQNVYSTIACGLSRLKGQLFGYALGILLKIVAALLVIVGVAKWPVVILAVSISLLVYSVTEHTSLKVYLEKKANA